MNAAKSSEWSDRQKARAVGRAVRRLRMSKGWSQAELARRSGYTRQAISLIEQGAVSVSGPGRVALASALGSKDLQENR